MSIQTWGAAFEASPADTDDPSFGAQAIRTTREQTELRLTKEHEFDLAEGFPQPRQGLHRTGSAVCFVQATAPTQRNGVNLAVIDKGVEWYNTTTRAFSVWDGTVWVAVSGEGGAGGVGVNFIYGQFETGVDGWATYADTAGVLPVDGTGGSANITITKNTVTPLFGTGDLLITKDAANRQGNGASCDFTIDNGATGRPIRIPFSYKVRSGTYADGDIGVFIFDITNGVVIQPSVVDIANTNGAITDFVATFFASTSLSYRLIFHIKSTSTAAYTISIDNIAPDIQGLLVGPAINNEVGYTPTIVGAGAGVSVTESVWRRAGDQVVCRGKATTGTVDGTAATISLPSGIKTPVGVTDSIIGWWHRNSTTAGGSKRGSIMMTANSSVVYITNDADSVGQSPFVGTAFNSIIANSQVISWWFCVPISGGGSTVNMITDFTEYAYNTSTSTVNDTTSFGFGPSGALFQAFGPSGVTPVEKYIQFTRPMQATDKLHLEIWNAQGWVDADALGCNIQQNDAGSIIYGMGITPLSATQFSVKFYSKFDKISAWGAFPTYRWRVRKISNGNMAEVPTLVRAEYTNDAGTLTNVAIKWTTRQEDTHSVYSSSTGQITNLVSGVYRLTVYSGSSSAINWGVYKNGSFFRYLGSTPAGTSTTWSISIRTLTSDVWDIRTIGGATSANASSYFQIERIGG